MARLPSVVCLSLTLLAACQPSQPDGARERAEPEPELPAEPEPPSQAQVEPVGPATARAYVSVARAGVFVIDERGWRLAQTSRAPVRDLAEIAGELVVLTSNGVQRVADSGMTEPLASLESASYRRLGEPRAMAGREVLWVLGVEGLGRWDGAWSFSDAPGIATDIAMDATEHAWLITDKGVRRQAESSWAAVELPTAFAATPTQLASSADAQTLVVEAGCAPDRRTCALVRFVAEQPTSFEFEPPACASLGVLALSPSGERAVLAGPCGLVRFDFTKPDAGVRPLELDAGWTGLTPDSLALDDGGRVWIGALHGLVIVDAVDQLEHYPLARLTEIAGVVDHLLVTGAGPTLPKLGDERRGGLRATLVHAQTKAPIAAAKLELCSQPRQPDPSRSACAGVESTVAATTDADGRFAILDLPIATYAIAVELDGRWALVRPKSMTMRAGMTGDLGKIPVSGTAGD